MKPVQLYNPLTRGMMPVERIIGEYSQGREGPLLVVLAGIHGNEPSGVQGCYAVLQQLRASQPRFNGRIVGIAGNLPALSADRRHIDEDLNRIWLDDRINDLQGARFPKTVEERELLAILDALPTADSRGNQPSFFIDCHTTSCASLPYISVPNEPRCVEWVKTFPLHAVVGAGDALIGTSDRYLINRGFTGFTFEAGRHGSLAAAEAQEAAIWLAIQRAGCIGEAPNDAEQFLCSFVAGERRCYQIEYVHFLTANSRFRMQPGYCNFQRISAGELLAWEGDAPIYSQWSARIFLPLYQEAGDDGFSVIRETGCQWDG